MTINYATAEATTDVDGLDDLVMRAWLAARQADRPVTGPVEGEFLDRSDRDCLETVLWVIYLRLEEGDGDVSYVLARMEYPEVDLATDRLRDLIGNPQNPDSSELQRMFHAPVASYLDDLARRDRMGLVDRAHELVLAVFDYLDMATIVRAVSYEDDESDLPQLGPNIAGRLASRYRELRQRDPEVTNPLTGQPV